MRNDYTCDGCGKPFTIRSWVFRHQAHEPDCPNALGSSIHACDCDLNYHPECCPECNPLTESESDA